MPGAQPLLAGERAVRRRVWKEVLPHNPCAMDAILFVFFAVDMGLNLAVFAVKR